MGWTTRVLLPAGEGIFFLHHASKRVLGPTQPPIQGVTGALYQRVNRPGREGTTHLHPVQRLIMRGFIPSLSQYVFMAWCLLKHRDNFTFYLLRSYVDIHGSIWAYT